MGSVLEGSADVIDCGLTVFYVEGSGFEEDVGLGGGEPFADVVMWGGHSCPPTVGSRIGIQIRQRGEIQPACVSDPAPAAGGDSRNQERNAVAVAEFLGAFFEKAD